MLAPAVTAVLLHEVVSHALETDTLALGGPAEAAIGRQVGCDLLNVLDDPAGAPAGVARTTDDEGVPVIRRWLLQQGVVKEPIADQFAAARSSLLTPGCARRGARCLAPVPRSTHLELLAGEASAGDLLAGADGGIYLPQVSRGSLDPVTGDFVLHLPVTREIQSGELADFKGGCRLRGRVSELLSAVVAIGRDTQAAGAGWCAKGGQRLAVWATAPAIRIEGLQIE